MLLRRTLAPSLKAAPRPLFTPSALPRRTFSSTPTLPAKYRRFGDSSSSDSSYSSRPRLPFNFRRPPTFLLLVGGGSGLWVVTHLERVPQTGRLRFMDTSKAMERAMAEQGYRDVMAQYGGHILPDHHPVAQYVQGVVRRITNASALEGGETGWKCHVVADPETRNAFVLPGGQIFVFTGILPICANEDGLAIVLGHEIAHQVARHGAERMSYGKILLGLGLFLQSLGLDPGITRPLLNLFMTLPNSRSAETEADFIGLQLATRACFDPRAATALWERMDAAEGGGGQKGNVNVDFLSTHPSSSRRIGKVTEWAKEMIGDRPGTCGPLEDQVGMFRLVARRVQW